VPCFRCGVRQSDPDRGPSTWKRGVRGGRQVLICPQCQRTADWTDDLDRCPSCAATALARVLGDTVCRACGVTVGAAADPLDWTAPLDSATTAAGLTDEVAAAIARVLRGDVG
jgi:hypothetical protein